MNIYTVFTVLFILDTHVRVSKMILFVGTDWKTACIVTLVLAIIILLVCVSMGVHMRINS